MDTLPSERNSEPLQNLEGELAKVTLLHDSVVIKPTNRWNTSALNQKMEREKLFKQLTSGLSGVYHPRVLSEDPQSGTYEMERARGINLRGGGHEQVGGITEFLELPLELKVNGVIAYLETVATLNKKGYSFVDHKSDSVFIDPTSGNISIVDASELKAEPNPQLRWTREKSGDGLVKVLWAFFTKGYSDDEQNEEGLVPNGLIEIFGKIKDSNSADDILTLVRRWRDSENSSTSPEEMRKELRALANGYNLMTKWSQKIEETDFSNLKRYQFDLLEAQLYTEGVLKTGKPHLMDKYSNRN